MWKFVSGAGKGSPFLFSTNDHIGRQTWEFDPHAGTPEERARVEELRARFAANRHQQRHSGDELLRLQNAAKIEAKQHSPPAQPLQPGEQATPERVEQHLKGAISFFECLQSDEGYFPGDYGGPMFLMPGLIIMLHTTGVLNTVLSPQHKQEMLRYLANHQNEDGGFGLHIEGHSTMFGTVLSYVSVRLLGLGPDEPLVVSARDWIHERGGATWITSWGKFWLAVLGVYSWDGLNPLSPEMWLLPHSKWTGIGWLHPGRYWCHCRMVYLPMAYTYGVRGTARASALTDAIRGELYVRPYSSIDWNAARNQIAKEDLYYPHPLLQDVLWWALYKAEAVLQGSSLRKAALKECMKLIKYEDENTRYIDIGPVNKVMNMLACWLDDPHGEAFKKHIPRVYDYLWVAEDGMKMQGYNGSHLWDTAFAVQAFADTGLLDVASNALKKAHAYVQSSQVVTESEPPLERYYRHISKGAWPFSSRDHGWPIADCTSEGLKAAIVLARLAADRPELGTPIPEERFQEAVNVILSYQNSDGGMATYENTRSFHALEILNPAETFGDIIVDYSYVELTSACVTALLAFSKHYPGHRSREIKSALGRAEKFIRSIQRRDGSWYGSWAVCFTYGTWFGCTSLASLGGSYASDEALRRACGFLVARQQLDGGWGESYLSSQNKVYSQLESGSHVVNTAWAMMALLAASYHKHDPKPLHAAARYLMNMQESSGDWPQQTISGVFNRNCMITYTNYRYIFPIWALGLYRRLVLLGQERDPQGDAWLCAVSANVASSANC